MRATTAVSLAVVVLLISAVPAGSVIGWCGNIWPVNGATYTSDEDITFYVQVWKEGVTDQPGQGANIDVGLHFRCQGDPEYVDLEMSYNTDVGNNDEYMRTVPAGHGCDVVDFFCRVTDLTDATTCDGQDQNSNDPPFLLPITAVTVQEVTVSFHVCLSGGASSSGELCVTGNHAELTNWGSGVVMAQECPSVSPRVFTADVVFPAGSNPSVQYKYRKDACTTWESTGNRSFVIDDSSATMDLAMDSWNNQAVDCPDCETPVLPFTWGTVKAIYR